MNKLILTAALLGTAATPALAATTATSTTDLNLRAAPMVNAEIVDVIASGDSVDVEGCVAEENWCKVSYNGTEGWAYGAYLDTTFDDQQATLAPAPVRTEKVTVIQKTEKDSTGAVLAGGATAAAAAAIAAGGPLAIAGAAVAGAITGDLATPDKTTTTYVREHPVDPIYVEGEVVKGATVPETIDLYAVPDSDYQYVMLNGVPVIVNGERQIVEVVR